MRVVLRSGEPFAFAGLWSVWRDPDGNRIPSCAIITTTAKDLLKPIHDRMPAILPREIEGFWLDGDIDDPDALRSVLTPYPDDAMDAYEVSTVSTPPSTTVLRSSPRQSDSSMLKEVRRSVTEAPVRRT